MRREGHRLQNAFFERTDKEEPIWIDSFQYAILTDGWKCLGSQLMKGEISVLEK